MTRVDWHGRKNLKVEIRKPSVKFCPKCGSTDIFWASGLPQLWSLWQCRNCGYRGAFILEDGELATKLQEEWKKEKRLMRKTRGISSDF